MSCLGISIFILLLLFVREGFLWKLFVLCMRSIRFVNVAFLGMMFVYQMEINLNKELNFRFIFACSRLTILCEVMNFCFRILTIYMLFNSVLVGAVCPSLPTPCCNILNVTPPMRLLPLCLHHVKLSL